MYNFVRFVNNSVAIGYFKNKKNVILQCFVFNFVINKIGDNDRLINGLIALNENDFTYKTNPHINAPILFKFFYKIKIIIIFV